LNLNIFPYSRDIARMLADGYGKRVMIVDTSNEIGGDGDIPHAGIGTARRMQVPHSDMQHKVCTCCDSINRMNKGKNSDDIDRNNIKDENVVP
jgi:stage III sporulation protein SpoIIIAA